jgi:protoporphyrinogen oxidase
VVERAASIGGLCATFRHNDMRLDYGPHKCFSVMPDVLEELRTLMGPELLRHEKKHRIYLFNRYLKYPLEIRELLTSMGLRHIVASGASALAERLRLLAGACQGSSYEAYLTARFGRHLYELVFEPLADKVWGDPATLSEDIARTRIPSSSFFDVLLRVLKLKEETSMTDATHFYYPKAGFGRIPERMAEELIAHGGTVLTAALPVAIRHEQFRITGVAIEHDGQWTTLPCDLLISTIPFDVLGGLLETHRSEPNLVAMHEAANRLQYRHLILVYVVVSCDQLTDDHWIFYPDREQIFGRIFEQKQLSRTMVPDGKTVICCDIVADEAGDRWCLTDAQLGERCVRDLRASGIINGQRVLETFVKRSRRFYPRYDLAYRDTLSRLYTSMKRYDNLLSTGRIGLYNYNNSDHCLDMAMRIEEGLTAAHSTAQIMEELEEWVMTYRIVD